MSSANRFPVRAFVRGLYGNMLTGMIDRIGSKKPGRLYLREWMEDRHLDNKRVAERMDRAEATVSKLLSGKMKMTLEYLYEFAEALNIEPEQLFRDPARPTRDELLRGYSNEELTSAIQLIEHTRSLAERGQSGMVSDDDLTRNAAKAATGRTRR